MTTLNSVLRFSWMRYPVLLLFFLFTGNRQQAFEKSEQERLLEMDLTFMYQPVVSFHPGYVEYLEGELDRILGQRRFNGTVLVAHKGKAVYNKSFGLSHVPSQRPFESRNNTFQLASVGKQFTAVAVLMLAEQGLLRLDDPVALHLEGFPHEDITVRHLLNHTSGLQNYMYLLDNRWKQERLPGLEDLMRIMQPMPLNFRPGSRFAYSNTGYGFLALLVERLSGKSFASFMHDHIFVPSGMKHSFVFTPDMDMDSLHAKGIAAGHERMGRSMRVIPADHVDGIAGDKGIFASAEDLLRWDNALEMNLLISEESKMEAFSHGRLRSGYAISYGFGYRLRRHEGDIIPYHNGWWRGFRTTYVRMPDNTLIVILNNTNASINGLDRQIWNIISRSPWPRFGEEELLLAAHL